MINKKIELDPKTNERDVKAILAKEYNQDYDFNKGVLTQTEAIGRTRSISNYIISRPLAEAVHAAIITGRPLLIKGEPGSGKTKLAQAVAVDFYGDEAYRYYFEWHVKSKSKAADGGYVFDHVGRLRDATIAAKDDAAAKRVAEPSNYITLGPMGKAFTVAGDDVLPILLIDEIDKGDIDFPNDLLLELDEMRFKINELPNTYIEAPKNRRPLVFITSNNERELPPAFLRRCIYYTIPEFSEDLLKRISASKINEYYTELKLEQQKALTPEEYTAFVQSFTKLKKTAITKPPSTSEMLDWLKLLTYQYHQEDVKFDDLLKQESLQSLALKLYA